MPAHMRELIIPGGNHANFGNYGAQQNDGEATITREEQQILTARAIADFADYEAGDYAIGIDAARAEV